MSFRWFVCLDSSLFLPSVQASSSTGLLPICHDMLRHRHTCGCGRTRRKAIALQASSSINMLGSSPIRGVSRSHQQTDVLLTVGHTPAATSTAPLDASPASPRLFSSTDLPQTPPSQLLRAVSSPPNVRRLRNIASPPPASHPILSSAITVACTIAPDSTRLPRQRQLAFTIQNTPPAQHASPFAAAATLPEPPSLLDKINSLPGPQQLLRSILTDNKASLSFQDSGMLTHMLHRATLFPAESNGCVVGSSSVGSACR